MSGGVSGKPTDGPISRYLNRRISTRITAVILKYDIGLTPTQISIISFSIGLLASYLYLVGNFLVAGTLVQLSSIMDGVDGELARARNQVSVKGGFIDTILDRVSNIFILISITLLLLFESGMEFSIIFIGFAALSADLLVTYLHAVAQKDLKVHPALIGVIPPIASRDVRLFIIFLASLIAIYNVDLLLYGLFLMALLTYTYIIGKFVELIRFIEEVNTH